MILVPLDSTFLWSWFFVSQKKGFIYSCNSDQFNYKNFSKDIIKATWSCCAPQCFCLGPFFCPFLIRTYIRQTFYFELLVLHTNCHLKSQNAGSIPCICTVWSNSDHCVQCTGFALNVRARLLRALGCVARVSSEPLSLLSFGYDQLLCTRPPSCA